LETSDIEHYSALTSEKLSLRDTLRDNETKDSSRQESRARSPFAVQRLERAKAKVVESRRYKRIGQRAQGTC
jgi:hypothetical protein